MDYIFYKEDLYGYSVFEIGTNKVFNYYPLVTFKENIETFIGTDIHYNVQNNIFAVEGCYWACPWDIFLFRLNNPMERFTEIINIRDLIDPEYKKYGCIDFVGWENNNRPIRILPILLFFIAKWQLLSVFCRFTNRSNIKLKVKSGEINLTEEEYKNKLIKV
ncbi:hypothetical protein ACYULU_07640 [Breznakiellaceae bacterium SP9]